MSSSIRFGSVVTEHELLSRTIPNLFTSVRSPQIASTPSPAPAWERAPVPQPRRGAPNLKLGSVTVSTRTRSQPNTTRLPNGGKRKKQQKKQKKRFFLTFFLLRCSFSLCPRRHTKVLRNEWSSGSTSTTLRDWHTPHTPPPALVSFGERDVALSLSLSLSLTLSLSLSLCSARLAPCCEERRCGGRHR
jgi:hypothetical protein